MEPVSAFLSGTFPVSSGDSSYSSWYISGHPGLFLPKLPDRELAEPGSE
ncbi:hypothetical protein M128_4349 [Bacteroides fragilis str. S6L8]|nr:hypothetical protein M074_4184 [Bacteroides fragilis str. DS-166]EYA02798.1 hypothetical protein M126_4339 [Bacteroides fragilis str. S6L3]EYA07328.1 hypothetical protein M130_4332 [Bacteroides fragilis str. S6R6]EYA82929.1 hypothetical protein M137_5226 [Bacteroides fragilis str. S36L12]EYA88566.1 hypothetical protein M135_4723 [Bacteroides fragilis str. S36L5]EYA98353.1 hypothetical protein M128_4349 [Bacteroides fragilis str. S6L8]EYB02944.1 hypothetical protein M129_4364 [Bacteroides f